METEAAVHHPIQQSLSAMESAMHENVLHHHMALWTYRININEMLVRYVYVDVEYYLLFHFRLCMPRLCRQSSLHRVVSLCCIQSVVCSDDNSNNNENNKYENIILSVWDREFFLVRVPRSFSLRFVRLAACHFSKFHIFHERAYVCGTVRRCGDPKIQISWYDLNLFYFGWAFAIHVSAERKILNARNTQTITISVGVGASEGTENEENEKKEHNVITICHRRWCLRRHPGLPSCTHRCRKHAHTQTK